MRRLRKQKKNAGRAAMHNPWSSYDRKSQQPQQHDPAGRNYPPVPPEQRPRIGLEANVETVVPDSWTIRASDSRLPPVLSTPAMIGMMEVAAAQAVQADLSTGFIPVGTRIEVDRLKAVPAGATVQARARLVQYDGRSLVFEVEAQSGESIIGRGRVFRAIVEPQKFHAEAHSRKE
jgi:predicted thioesterase